MDNVAKPAKEFYSVEEVIAKLGVGRTLAYKMLTSGEIKSIKVGVRRLIPINEYEAFVTRGGTSEAA
jgi:excisionase family DNA binding protein